MWATVKKYNISANLVLCFLAPGHPPGARIQIDEIQAVKLLGLGQAVVLSSEFGIHPDNEVGSTAQNVTLRDPSTLPLQRQLFNLMWKYTVVLVLLLLRLTGLNIAVIAAEGTQVCFLYFPVRGHLRFWHKNCRLSLSLSMRAFCSGRSVVFFVALQRRTRTMDLRCHRKIHRISQKFANFISVQI